ncbi:MAG: glycosyltransferase family 2 protein [Gemmatimonadaceae bacterium]|nr:glycosyltransferase family 2 protein [Gemmatimonadaceae bacterium]
MTASDVFVSVVAPLSNDSDILPAFVEETIRTLRAHYVHYELLLVDDGSTDDSVRAINAVLAHHESVRLIRLSRSFGSEVAISAGLDAAIGDFVVVMLPDSDPPALIPRMVAQSRQGIGVVFGIRKSRVGEPLLLRLGATVFYRAGSTLLGLNIPPDSTHFRVLSRQTVNAIVQIRDRNRYLRTLSGYVGYASQSVEYEPLHRRTVTRRKSVLDGAKLAMGIIVANSLQPLYLAVGLGLLVVAANTLFVAYVVGIYLLKRHVAEGWTTQSLILGGMFGAIGALLTIVAAYLARLLGENQDRPLYFVLEERQSAVASIAEDRMNIVADPVVR